MERHPPARVTEDEIYGAPVPGGCPDRMAATRGLAAVGFAADEGDASSRLMVICVFGACAAWMLRIFVTAGPN